MKKPRLFLYVVYLLFISLSFAFILFTDELFDEFGIQKTLNFLRGWSIFGLCLFLFSILAGNYMLRRSRKISEKLEKENEHLKAKIYDMEEKNREVDNSLKSFENSLNPKNKPGKEGL